MSTQSNNGFTPICMERQLLFPEGGRPDVAWVCLWTKKERKLEEIKENGWVVPAVIGNLYSHKRGVDLLIRNLLANPQIRFLVVHGAEMNESGSKLRALMNGDITESLLEECGVGKDIPMHIVKELFYPELLTLIVEPSELNHYDNNGARTFTGNNIFPPIPPELSTVPPGTHVGAVVRGSSISETWLRLLKHIRLYGQISGTHYDMRQQEVYGMLAIVEKDFVCDQGAAGFTEKWDEFLPMEGYEEYANRLWSDELPAGVQYTYGYRLRHGLSRDMGDVDQITGMIMKLVLDPDQRSACASLWYGSDSVTKSGTPCVDLITCRIINKQLLMSVTIRSNDMAGAWPMNVAGFRNMQHRILRSVKSYAKASAALTEEEKAFFVDLEVGATEVYSLSAHIYEDSWTAADDMVDKYYEKYTGRVAHPADPFGNWIIEVAPIGGIDFISATLLGPDEKQYRTFVGRTAGNVRTQIGQYLHNSDHALYLGMELMKAEMCMYNELPYVQDKVTFIKVG